MADLDEQLLSSLEAVQELQTLAQGVNRRLRDGFMNISEARFGSRWNKINHCSFPLAIEPTLRVVLRGGGGSDGGPPTWVLQREEVEPAFRKRAAATQSKNAVGKVAAAAGSEVGGLRRRAPASGAGTGGGGGAKEEAPAAPAAAAAAAAPSRSGVVRMAAENTDPKRDPLGWFGLPPPALKRAQMAFREAFDRVPTLATLACDVRRRTDLYGKVRPPTVHAAVRDAGDSSGGGGSDESGGDGSGDGGGSKRDGDRALERSQSGRSAPDVD